VLAIVQHQQPWCALERGRDRYFDRLSSASFLKTEGRRNGERNERGICQRRQVDEPHAAVAFLRKATGGA
jgi:hypothetical protein